METRARVERQRTRDEAALDVLRESMTYRHQVFWYVSRDLELSGEFIHADLRGPAEDRRGRRRRPPHRQRSAGGRGLQLARRPLADRGLPPPQARSLQPGALESWVRRIYAGGNGHVTRNWEFTGEIHYAWLEGRPLAYEDENRMIENARLRFLLETSLDLRRHARCALGFERVDYDEDSDPTGAADFDASRVYLKLIGQF